MICTTCGRDNPGQLVFCQECGQRLPRPAAAPTPPLGVPPAAGVVLSPLAATSLAPAGGSPAAAAPVAVRSHPNAPSRPAAPAVRFAPKTEFTGTVPCGQCGAQNQATVRFCVACGKPLGTAAEPPAPAPRGRSPANDLAKTVPTPPPVHDPTPAPPSAQVAAARVVDLGAPAPAPARMCPRCRAPSDGAAQFCRLCGAPLGEGPVMRPTPAPMPRVPPAPPPAPAPAPAAPPRTTVPVARSDIARASIVIVARDGGEGPAYPLGEVTDIGRTEGDVLIGDDAYISPRHARITRRGQQYFLRDLESTNGVFVRLPFAPASAAAEGDDPGPAGPGESEAPLGDQDLFLVGQQVLRFEVVKGAEEGFGVASENGTLLFGCPVSPRYARLVQRSVEGVSRDVFHVRKTETVLGRESGDVVFTDDPFLSRRHAAVRAYLPARDARGQPARFTLADLGSSNGTFLRIHEEVRLRSGDSFRVGQQLFRFDLEAPHVGA